MTRVVLILLSLFIALPADAENVLHEERSLYSNLLVKRIGNRVCLQFSAKRDVRNQTCMNERRPREMVFSYTRMTMSALLFTPQPQSMLVVGLGGGTLPTAFRELFPNMEIDALEIDPAVINVAQRYFNFKPDENMRVHAQDARLWIKRAAKQGRKFDLIILDAFNGDYIPEHLMTQEFFSEVDSILSAQGIMVSNTFEISRLYDHESATYASVFPSMINFQAPESANRLIMAPKTDVEDDVIKARARTIATKLRPYGVPIKRYARMLVRQRGEAPDWNTNARVLTDQYAPANLLRGGD